MAFDFSQSAYRRLQESMVPDTNRFVVWCGAGLSAPAGIPAWAGLRKILEDALREKATHQNEKARDSIERQLPIISKKDDPWVAFQMLKDMLGDTTYKVTIRDSLAVGNSAEVPMSYRMLWHLHIAGMITLNLDALSLRAFNYEYAGKHAELFTGSQLANYMHVLKNPNMKFLCHLHGVDADVSSWIFTHNDLRDLAKTEAYNDFLATILTSFTVIFVGISADDVAVGSHLQRLKVKGFDFGSHYWITNRNDPETSDWAETTAVQMIYYTAYDNDHSELETILSALANYVPRDDSLDHYPPAMHTASLTPITEIPSPGELTQLSPDDIRTILNRKALDILRPGNSNRDAEFAEFLNKYGRPIHYAWYVDTVDGENNLLGYELIERKDRGAFGQIYKAISPQGDTVAIKLLKDEVRVNPNLLQSFRRGVRAMQILSENHVRGMVAYKEAYEIPTFVAMDWIDGYDLRKAIEMDLIDSWKSLLDVCIGIASILKTAHSLAERVLHRDLRPANIMVNSKQPGKWEVSLLDFDLSWYLGSVEQSVVHGSDSFGFLAPEQIVPREGASTRHPAVDSYGLGMTFYFTISRRNPSPNQHMNEGWEDTVRRAASTWKRPVWKSTPNRFARLVGNMTRDSQMNRWDLAEIELELKRIYEAETKPGTIKYADMLAEEIAARSGFLKDYVWNHDKQSASLSVHQAGLSLDLIGNQSREMLQLVFTRVSALPAEKFWAKRISETGDKISRILSDAGWGVSMSGSVSDVVVIDARFSIRSGKVDIDNHAATLDLIGDALQRF